MGIKEKHGNGSASSEHTSSNADASPEQCSDDATQSHSSNPKPDTELLKKGQSSPSTSELLSKVEASSPSELALTNPFHFVCYWEDANKHRDFGVKLEPTEKFGDFVVTEAKTLGVDMSRAELARFSQRSIVKFTVTYSKRNRNGKTRGASTGPKRLTEELVGWIRSDLASMGQRQATSPSRSRAKRIDEQTRRLMGK